MKRPIDRKREAGGQMSVGTPDDQSAITTTVVIGKAMYIVKERGIYEIKLADQIDPDRTNIDLPNTQQRVLNHGSNSALVGRTLLTASSLFKKSYLPERLDLEEALRLTFDILKDLAAMLDVMTEFEQEQRAAIESVGGAPQRGAIIVPTVGNVATICKEFIQKADHTLQRLLSIVRLFYGTDAGRKWYEGLSELILSRYGQQDDFYRFLLEALPFLKFIRNTRNCVEHPKADKRLVIQDFAVEPNGAVVAPTIEVVHPDTPHAPVLISEFIRGTHECIVTHRRIKYCPDVQQRGPVRSRVRGTGC